MSVPALTASPSFGSPSGLLKTFSRYADLIGILAEKNIRSRYRGSILGVYWSLSNPILMALLYTAIFGSAFEKYYDNSLTEYAVSAFVGVAVMQFFMNCTMQGLTAVAMHGSLLNKIRLPVTVFPCAVVAANAYQWFIGTFPVLLLICALKTHSIINLAALFIPMAGLILTAIGFTMLLSALFVYFRDLTHIWEIAGFVLWISSPIFYSSKIIPVRFHAIIRFNPIAVTMESLRQVALQAGTPDIRLMLGALATGVVVCLIGATCFAILKRNFMDNI